MISVEDNVQYCTEVAAALRIAAAALNIACDVVERRGGGDAYWRLAEFDWEAISGSLEEVVAEFYSAADYVEGKS